MSESPLDAGVMLPASIRAVLFDFDGTLAPNLDLPDMRRQVIALTEGFAVPAAAYADRYIVEVIEAARDWLIAAGQSAAAGAYHKQAHELITEIEISAAADTRIFDGVPELLHTLRTAGIQTGIVTRNCRPAVLQVFPDASSLVDSIRTRSDVTHLKPDPRHLRICLEDINCVPEHAAMVGDGALDMRAGKALGLFCIGVLTGSADADALSKAGADRVLDNVVTLSA
ncbi:MAG: HAD family hydrolase [Pseudomonadota bacterium]